MCVFVCVPVSVCTRVCILRLSQCVSGKYFVRQGEPRAMGDRCYPPVEGTRVGLGRRKCSGGCETIGGWGVGLGGPGAEDLFAGRTVKG